MILLILTTPPYYSCAKPALLMSFHLGFVSGFDKKKQTTLGGVLLPVHQSFLLSRKFAVPSLLVFRARNGAETSVG